MPSPLPDPGQADRGADAAALRRAVAARYAGASRWARGFVAGKLRADPVVAALLARGAARPFGHVLDLGCGRGQLGLALLQAGCATALLGLDRDRAKLAEARAAAADLPAAFAEADFLAPVALPECDTVLLVDVLYLLPEPAQQALLARAAAAARRRVLIRAFDPARGWRSAVGHAAEQLGRLLRGDLGRTAIAPLPVGVLAATLRAAGFARIAVAPCWGRTPLPNVLLDAEREEA
ncbi:methyltransferase domain-containing protein [Caldovatus aquaticus]|uniref:Class I SAM-dependent methyltransferase n=1 Tax=Caldovatus aquaticus TaxID=2865671 RepID=A0ABS7F4N1_9PROT|nr:class I SAM-dependent methyltransferase [Caldovatus aquaticus]